MNDQICSYIQQGFTMPIISNEAKGYASVNAEMYENCDGGLDCTSNYQVYLLHPAKGSFNFKMEFDAEKDIWIKSEIIHTLDRGVVREIANRIKLHSKGQFSKLTDEFYITKGMELFELEQ